MNQLTCFQLLWFWKLYSLTKCPKYSNYNSWASLLWKKVVLLVYGVGFPHTLCGYGVISDRSLTRWLSHALLWFYHLSSRPDLTSMLVYEVGSHGARQTQETSNYLLLLVRSCILVFSMKNNKLKTFNYRVGCWGNSLKSWRGCLYFELWVLRARPILSPHFGHQVEATHQNGQSCVKAFRKHIKWACVRLYVRREGTLTSCRYCTQIRDTFFPHFASLYQEFHWKFNSNKVTQTC